MTASVIDVEGIDSLGAPHRSAKWMIVRGGFTAAGSLGIPFLLSNILARGHMNSWVLIVGLTSWIRLLDLGINTAVVRFVARERSAETQDQVVRAGSEILRIPAIVAVCGLATLAIFFDRAYPAASQIPGARGALVLMSVVGAAGLLVYPANGFFIAQHRGRFLAAALIASKAVQFVLVVTVAKGTKSLIWIALAYSISELAGGMYVWTKFRRSCPRSTTRIPSALRSELRRHCASSAVWAVSGIFVASLDTAVVARVESGAVSEYGLCLALTATVGGLHAALLSPVIAQVASITGPTSVGEFVLKTARQTNRLMAAATTFLLLCTPLVLIAAGSKIDRTRMATVLAVLHLANFLRFLGAPYSSALLGTGEHRKVVASPVLEAIVNLTASIGLGHFYGAIGVAIGTLIGAFMSLALHLGYNMTRTTLITIAPRRYLYETVLPNLALVVMASGVTMIVANR